MRLLLIPIFASIFPLVQAQEVRPVKCRFLAFKATGAAKSVLATSESAGDILCPLPGGQLSAPVICYAKNNVLGFVAVPGGKPVATATIPPDASAAFLIFVPKAADPSGKDPTTWRVLTIADTPKNFPDGGTYVANFYNSDIRFVIGEHKGMLHAGGAHGYSMPEKLDDFNMAPTVFELQKGDQWRTASESSMRFLPGMRYLIFAYQDPVSGRPRISTYQDLAPIAIVQATPPTSTGGR